MNVASTSYQRQLYIVLLTSAYLLLLTPKIPSEDSSQNYDTRANDDTNKEKRNDVARYLTPAQL